MKIFGFESKTLIKDLIISLIGIALVSLFSKIIHVIPVVGRNIAKIIPAIIYSQAALVTEYFLVNYFFIIIIICSFIFGIFFLIDKLCQTIKDIKKLLKSSPKENKEISIENKLTNLENKISELENEIKQTEKKILRNNKVLIVNYIINAIYILFLSFFFIIMFVLPFAYKYRFDINITKIKPYTTIENIYKLESDWTMMKSKDDYKKIDLAISKIIEDNNLTK